MKDSTLLLFFTFSGSAFHTVGAAYVDALLPKVYSVDDDKHVKQWRYAIFGSVLKQQFQTLSFSQTKVFI